MRTILLLLLSVTSLSFADHCPAGGVAQGPLSLHKAQERELRLSVNTHDRYGHYNPYGNIEEGQLDQSYEIALGMTSHINSDLSATAILPWVYRRVSDLPLASGVGDLNLELNFALYPAISTFAGARFPTGSKDSFATGSFSPGTGQGYTSPYLGFFVSREWGPFRLGFQSLYTIRLPSGDVDEGDGVTLTEVVSFSPLNTVSLSVGGSQMWSFQRSIAQERIADTGQRDLKALFGVSWNVQHHFSLHGGLDFSVPIHGAGVNHPASQNFSLTAQVGLQ